MKQIEEIIRNTTEEEQEKVDWIKAWSTKYPVLATYQKEVDIPKYSFNEDKTLIRANQGHSIDVDVELPKKQPPVILYHGTGEKYVASIDEQGLIPKSRLYVHYLVMKQLQLLSAQDMGDLWCMKYLRVRCTMTVMNSFNL